MSDVRQHTNRSLAIIFETPNSKYQFWDQSLDPEIHDTQPRNLGFSSIADWQSSDMF